MATPIESDKHAVAADLTELAKRQVHRAFRRLGKKDAPDLEHLQIVAAQHFPGSWEAAEPDTKAAHVERLLRQAARRLSGQFGSKMSNEYAALRMFNIDGRPDFPKLKKLTDEFIDGVKKENDTRYGYLRRLLLQDASLADDGQTRAKLTNLRALLAEQLTDPDFSLTPGASTATASGSGAIVVRPVFHDEFIARPGYEQLIRQLRDAGEPHVWLWGDAGTGKSRLARAANRDRLSERDVPVLTPGKEQEFQQQLVDLVVDSGVAPEKINSGNHEAWFFRQLNESALPTLLVFDEMPVGDLLSRLLSARGSFIVFTSIERPPLPESVTLGYSGPTIEVRNMAAEESQRMIHSRLPDIDETALRTLNTALAGRPLAIEHSCAFLRSTSMPVADYCAALMSQPADTLNAAGDASSRTTLTKVYEMTLERLADSSDSLGLLDYALFMSRGAITADMLAYLWAENLKMPHDKTPTTGVNASNSFYFYSLLDAAMWPGVVHRGQASFPYVDPFESVRLRAALNRLVDFGLIRSEGESLVMHQLTRAIIGSLRHDHAGEVFERIKTTVHELLVMDGWEPGEPVQAHMLPWAPHVAWAVAHIDAQAPGMLEIIAHDELKKLALLGAMVVRAHLQVGGLVVAAVESVKQLYALVMIRTLWEGYDKAKRLDLAGDFRGLYSELVTAQALSAGFSRELDGALLLNKQITPMQAQAANGIRLEYDTEWELSHNFVAVGGVDEYASKESLARDIIGSNEARLKSSAQSAMTVSRIYYDQCRWNDAIAALEHAYSCFVKIGADVGAIRGAIDAARRLSRVYLRAGPMATALDKGSNDYLGEATWWLLRAQEIKRRRSDAVVNGGPSRYRLRDTLLDAQLRQVLTQIELTRFVLDRDDLNDEVEFSFEDMATFAAEPYRRLGGELSEYSRLDEARQALDLLGSIRALRLVPEFRMHIVRLGILAGDLRVQDHVGNLDGWFDREKLSYQSALLAVQNMTVSSPIMMGFLVIDELDELIGPLADELREGILAMRQDPIPVANRYYAAARAMHTHGNSYWYARGLAATLIFGTVAEQGKAWIDAVRAELEQAALSIGRRDWLERVDGYDDSNAGLWLLGY